MLPCAVAKAQPSTLLAPPPDFRYVGLAPGPLVYARQLAIALGALATGGLSLACGMGPRVALAATAVTAVGALAAGRVSGRSLPGDEGTRGVPMAIVPWGVLLESDEQPRVLHWAAVQRVQVQMVHGTDGGSAMTLWSLVTVETSRERFAGRAAGAVPLERLAVHVHAYARESAHVTALDLTGATAGDGPLEPEFDPLLAAARAFLRSASSCRLGLPAGGYRTASVLTASPRAVDELRSTLCDRRDRPCDPRVFAAVLAAELRATELAEDVLALVQSPHPLLAAVAKVAATKLGVPRARAGAVEEVAPFLMPGDVEALLRWGRAS